MEREPGQTAWTRWKLGRKKLRAGLKKRQAYERQRKAILWRRFLRHRAVPPRDAARFQLRIRSDEAERQEAARARASILGLPVSSLVSVLGK